MNFMNTGRVEGTYNLTIADFETYFVGKNRILVHNCGGDGGKNGRKKNLKRAAAAKKNREKAEADLKDFELNERGTKGFSKKRDKLQNKVDHFKRKEKELSPPDAINPERRT